MGLALLLAAAPEGRIFALDRQTLIQTGIQLFNACVLAAALAFLLYRPVRNYMRKRADGISAQFSRAEERLADAEKAKALYEAKLGEIERERAEILEEAHRLAGERREELLGEAKEEAAAAKAQAEQEIRAQRGRVFEEARLQTIAMAAAMAGKFVAQSMDEAAQDRLFAEALRELEGEEWRS